MRPIRCSAGGQDRLSDAPAQQKLSHPDLPLTSTPASHARFKAACALNATDMVTELHPFIES